MAPRHRPRPRHAAIFFGHGSFAAVASQVVWLAAFLAGITALAAGVAYPQQASAFVLADACGADLAAYTRLYVCCFMSLLLCTFQASVAGMVQWIMGASRKLYVVPPWSSKWCRGLLFFAVVLCALSLACTVVSVNLFLVVKVGRFRCQSVAVRSVVVVADGMAGVLAVVLLYVGGYISLFSY